MHGMFRLSALRELGYVTGLRYDVDRVWLDLCDGKTLEFTWAEFGSAFRW